MQLGNDETNSIIPKLPKEQHADLQSFLSSFDFLDFPGPHDYPPSFDSEYNKAVIDSLIQNFSRSLFIENTTNFDVLLPAGSTSNTVLAATEVISMEQVSELDNNIVISPSEGNLLFLFNLSTCMILITSI